MSNTPAELWWKKEAEGGREGGTATSTLISPHPPPDVAPPPSRFDRTHRGLTRTGALRSSAHQPSVLPSRVVHLGVQRPNRDHINPNKLAQQPQPCQWACPVLWASPSATPSPAPGEHLLLPPVFLPREPDSLCREPRGGVLFRSLTRTAPGG